MDLWRVRSQALAALNENLKEEKEILEGSFSLFDRCIANFHRSFVNTVEHRPFSAACYQTLIRARRYALGIYSLYLDGLTIEAGALQRLLLEAGQLLVYFYNEPSRVEEAFADRLPRAGEIAREIEDNLPTGFKLLRDRYNRNASHISFSKEVLVGWITIYNDQGLKSHMFGLFIVMGWIIRVAEQCLLAIGQLEDNTLLSEIDSLIENGCKIFEIDEQLLTS